MSTTIDSLSIEIRSNSNNAAQGIRDLAKSLNELKQSGTVSVAIKNLNSLSAALKGFADASQATSAVGKLVGAMSRLKEVGKIPDIGSTISKLSASLQTLDNVNVESVGPQIKKIAEAVAPLSAIKAGGLGTMVNALSKLDKVTESLSDENIAAFAEKVKKLNSTLEPLSTKMTTIQTGLRGVNTGARDAGKSVKNMGSSVNATSVNFSSFIYNIQSVISWLNQAIQKFAKFIEQAIEWEGIAARFGRGFGAQAEEVYTWIKRLNEEMGINIQQFMQYSSVYATMLKGFGVTSEDAAKMALGYTELTYDLWAGYNDIYKTYEEAADAVKSAIAGEVEPIRRAGFTIVEATLEQTAANYGLEISLEKATEAQKSYLRYLTLVDQAYDQGLVGTYARELTTAEGLTRTLSQQLKSLTQAFGSLFLPILVKVVPWLQAFVELLTEAVHWVAALFGIEIQAVDWSSYNDGSSAIGGVTDSANEATSALGGAAKAAKELKNATLGIDELNVISPPDPNSGGGGGGGSGESLWGDLDIDSLWSESIFDDVQSKVDEIKQTIKNALASITAIVSGFALAIGTILVLTGGNLPLGISLMVLGAAGLVAAVAVNWDSMSTQLAKTLSTVTSIVGGFLLAIGALLAFSGASLPLGIALMVAGAASIATSAVINWKKLENPLNNTLATLTGIVGGSLLALGALLAFTGIGIGMGIAMMAAGAVSIVTAVGLNWNSMTEPVKKTVGTLETIVGGGLLALGAVLAFTGAALPLGIAMMAAGAVSLVSAVALNWNSLTGEVSKTLRTISLLAGGALLGIGLILALTGVALPLGIGLMAAGAASLIAGTVSINWDSIKKKIKEVFDGIKEWVERNGKLVLGIILCLTGAGLPVGIALIANSFKNESSGNTNDNGLLKMVKKKWNEAKTWLNGNPLKAGVELVKEGWTTFKEWIGKVPVIAQGVSLVKKGWSTVKGWIGNLPTISQSIGLAKSGWSSVKTWVGDLPVISQGISLVKSGWTSVKSWIGEMPSLSAKIKLLKDGWKTVKEWLGDLKFDLEFKLPKIKVDWGTKEYFGFTITYPKGFSTYAQGGFPDMGEFFVAREAGPEMVGKIGSRSAVVNNDQIVDSVSEGVYAAVLSAMKATGGNGAQSVNLYLDGKQITAAVEKRQRERGATIMGNQVYNN